MNIREHIYAADCPPGGCSQAIRHGPGYPALLWCPCLSRRWGQMDTGAFSPQPVIISIAECVSPLEK